MSPSEEQLPGSLAEGLRAWNPALARALDAEERGETSLSEADRALLDAFLAGVGYLVLGRRVDPKNVIVFHGPEGGGPNWKRTRWWRAVGPYHQVWAESSVEEEIRARARPNDRVQVLMERVEERWVDA